MSYYFNFSIYLFFYFLERFNYNSNMKLMNKKHPIQKIILAAYFKIFINYSQINAIVHNSGLNKNNSSFHYFSSFFQLVSGNFGNIITLECIINGKFCN